MKFTTRVFSSALLMISMAAWGQKGIVRGTVMDENGEPLFTANAVIKGTQNGTTTDFDGNFELKAEPGNYNLELSFIGYASTTVTDVEVKAGEVTVVDPLMLNPSANELATVTVTSESIRNTEAAMLTMKKKSVNVLDGISSQTFRKVGDSDAGAAVKRVPGVSVEGGKYVYVRGLGDRYTKTMLNGLDIPGLDPDRNSLQIDLFPTNIVNNIVILKSFTADLPADFVGGMVDIETKSFPEKPTLNVSVSTGFTPGMHFNDNFRTYEGGATDFLGFDDGSRNEPLGMSAENTNPIRTPVPGDAGAVEATRQFSPDLAARQATSPMNMGVGVSGGNQVKKGNRTYGYMGAFSFKNNTDYYTDYQQNSYLKGKTDTVYELRPEKTRTGDVGINNTYLTGLLGGALKAGNNKYKLRLMHLQNGEKRSAFFKGQDLLGNSNRSRVDVLDWSERSISNLLLSGEHIRDEGRWNIEWKVSPTYSQINDKDVRITPYLFDPADSSFSINPNEVDAPQRIWRELNEINLASRLDFEWEHSTSAKLKFGTGYTYKTRDFTILNYAMESRQYGLLDYSGNADELLSEDFLWSADDNVGHYYFGNYQPNNTYNGVQSNISLYVQEEYGFATRWKAVAGVRMEKYDQYYTGQNQKGDRVFNNDKVLDLLDLFPTASLIFELNESTNLRASYFRTTARPSFKEKSTAEIVDAITGRTFIGNIDLTETDIDNLDLRYEYFMEKNQTISVSAFYKSFKNPIELASYEQDVNSFQPRNVGTARVIGAELESRLGLDFVGLKDFSWNTNVTLVDSRVQFDRSEGGTYEGKLNGLRKGEDLRDYRDMQGQAPYIINSGISYQGRDNGWEGGVYYNVQGRRLEIVGINQAPDIYTEPFHSLNLNLMKQFGAERQFQVGFGVNNILDDKRESVTDSYRASEQVFSSYAPGRTFSLSFSYAMK